MVVLLLLAVVVVAVDVMVAVVVVAAVVERRKRITYNFPATLFPIYSKMARCEFTPRADIDTK